MTGYPFVAECERIFCRHSSSRHSLDDAQNVGPTDPGAKFRCQECECPDMIRSAQNLRDLGIAANREVAA